MTGQGGAGLLKTYYEWETYVQCTMRSAAMPRSERPILTRLTRLRSSRMTVYFHGCHIAASGADVAPSGLRCMRACHKT
jgi:hypothetical protein